MTRQFSATGIFTALARLAALATLAPLMACSNPGVAGPPATRDLSAEIVNPTAKNGTTPSTTADGICWAQDRLPTEGATDAKAAADAAPVGMHATSIIRFRAPCPEIMDEAFITTLQRALKARGDYAAMPNGRMDHITREAVRAYQTRRGLPSDQLSLAAAKEMGLVITPLDEL